MGMLARLRCPVPRAGAAALIALFAGAAQAQAKCGDGTSNAEMIQACAAELAALETRVNGLVNGLTAEARRKGGDADNIALLRRAQANWRAYRDAQCAWEADFYRGGTNAPLTTVSCRVAMGKDRAADLAKQLKELRKR